MTTFLGSLLEKMSATRYEKEIAKGTINRSDLGVPASAYAYPKIKRVTREHLSAPSTPSPEALARRRAINEKVYHAYANHPELHGTSGVSVEKRVFPGAGPATLGGSYVFSPAEAGRHLRGILSGGSGILGKIKALASTLVKPGTRIGEKILPKGKESDKTLARSILKHELGEASTFAKDKGSKIIPVASHLGARPIIEEQIANRGDPEAIKDLHRGRLDKGNQAVLRAIRSVGGTADSPIPIGGKQERAVNRILARHPEKLDTHGRTKAVQVQAAQLFQNPDANRESLPMDMSHIPSGVHESIRHIIKAAKGPLEHIQSGRTIKGLMDLRNLSRRGGELKQHLMNIDNFVKRGR